MPKVSVIVPTYNVSQYLDECMTSLINQTLEDMEFICVNDGSTDHSLEILQTYAAADQRVKIIDKPHGGYGKAMNVGLDNCTGEYIGILEPDDYVKTSMYGDLYELAEKYDLSDMVCLGKEDESESASEAESAAETETESESETAAK